MVYGEHILACLDLRISQFLEVACPVLMQEKSAR